jgi:hypothetical protein
MDAWVLAAIVCGAAAQPDGSYCTAKALDYGISREVCWAERQRWSGRFPNTRLECTEDPQLVIMLKEQDKDGVNTVKRMGRPPQGELVR